MASEKIEIYVCDGCQKTNLREKDVITLFWCTGSSMDAAGDSEPDYEGVDLCIECVRKQLDSLCRCPVGFIPYGVAHPYLELMRDVFYVVKNRKDESKVSIPCPTVSDKVTPRFVKYGAKSIPTPRVSDTVVFRNVKGEEK